MKISVGSSTNDIIATIKCMAYAITVDDLKDSLREEKRTRDRKALVKFLENRIKSYERAGTNPYAPPESY
jgi:hypothetical protein